ncbi:unnamed protein product [Amoebophrya sp. A25]|nr:unnamed protein product [Amoebophrya sp. A25]CAD7940516.1 unnamed protein product [Amoebophrya sp. A25]CAD7942185.1 unnamed protein product [Amoebophrya sp. A25]|eukprot:GSA25T00007467001.1
MSCDAKEISKKLGQKSDWRAWQLAIRQEASRLGLLQNYTNVVGIPAAPHGIPNGVTNREETIRQKWRNLKDAIIRSLKGAAASFINNQNDNGQVDAMDAGEVVVLLRDVGHFDQNNRQEQRMKVKPLTDGVLKFHNADQPADVTGFLSKVRDIMNQSPTVYPPEAGVPESDQQNGALLQKLPELFCKNFKATIERMQEEDGLTFDQIGDRLEKRLATLIEEGTYKVENDSFGKAFPVNVQETSNKRSREEEDDEEKANEGGKIFLSKSALKRFKANTKKKIAAEVYASNSNGKGKPQNKNNKGSGKQDTRPVCWICNKPGHKSASCWKNPQNQANWNWNTNSQSSSAMGKGGKGNGMVHMSQVAELWQALNGGKQS